MNVHYQRLALWATRPQARLAVMLAVTVSLLSTAALAQDAQRLTVPAGQLQWDTTGLSLTPSIAECPSSKATAQSYWSLMLESAPGTEPQKQVRLESAVQTPPTVTATSDALTLSYPNLTDGKQRLDVALTLTIRAAGDRFEIGGEIRNGTKTWLVKGFTGPVFHGLQADLAKTPLLMPYGFGYRIPRVPADEKGLWPWRKQGAQWAVDANYPSARGTMQWFAFAGQSGGIYFGSHDPRFGSKLLQVSYDPEPKTFSARIQHRFFTHPGQQTALPTLIVKPYKGDWHAAAREYRAWVDSVEKPIEKPAWAKTASGWLLTILKQQNGEIMWPYNTLDQLSEVADQHGLDVLGLFGWGYGGHDHLYPDYNPCPLMGGEAALREGIQKAHARGKRVILYANGQMMERGTAYWTDTGRHLAVTNKNGTTVQEFWHKYKDAPGYHFDIGCNRADAWRERLLMLAKQANDFGADGILYDQLGMQAALACYGEGHGHPVPSMVYQDDRQEMLRQIAETMRRINPDFVIMTEGFFDSLMDSIVCFHGCVAGAFPGSPASIARRQTDPVQNAIFPEMVRYTYPEVASTVRFPSPLLTREMANYTCAYGWRFEIESRYMPDRAYLVEGRIPKVEDYAQVRNKPDIRLMETLPRGETAAYMKRVTEFQKNNAPLLMTGTFTDTEGFTCEGPGIVAKGYRSKDHFGVLLWNTSDQAAGFTLRVPDADVISASEPEKSTVDAFSPLAPQTLRLLVWKPRD